MSNKKAKSDLTVWVLEDDRAGNVNQIRGVAEALGTSCLSKDIKYNSLAKLPNFLKIHGLIGVTSATRQQIVAPWPDVVLSAGRKTAPIALYIKKKSGNKTKAVQIMWPDIKPDKFDLLVLPSHDKRVASDNLKNLLVTFGAPNRIGEAQLTAAREKWTKEFSYLPAPKFALIIGGNTKKGKFDEDLAHRLVVKTSVFMEEVKGSLLITTSRRTDPHIIAILKQEIKQRFYFHDYTKNSENPYLGYLALADAIIVTGDSISMCSEAVSTGKPVFIYAPGKLLPAKHKRFIQALLDNGYAKPLVGHYEKYRYQALDESAKVASAIRGLFNS